MHIRVPCRRSRRSTSNLHSGEPLPPPQLSQAEPEADHPGPALNTPPGSPCMNPPYWKSRLTTIKNSFLGSPRFHRRNCKVISSIIFPF
ncbi:hypothetical protein CEXT_565061 [Caerostris extrusa]|uniref:Uncharacterized protein n=1 Tax=Caerostris extrusa TaxID=172846 RepID=A0AAV4RH44_CAEEX|nr:hypothetical protein CEXT_565061 [Caerostris extrusa]